MPQPTADDDAEYAVEQQVIEVGARPASLNELRMRLDAPLAKPPELQKGQQVHQPVPVNGQRAELEGDGVELGMKKHGGGGQWLKQKADDGSCFPTVS